MASFLPVEGVRLSLLYDETPANQPFGLPHDLRCLQEIHGKDARPNVGGEIARLAIA